MNLKADMEVAEDRGEQVSSIEPLVIEDGLALTGLAAVGSSDQRR
jgi:hypothetical protein